MRVCTCNQFVGPAAPWTGPNGGNCSLCWTYQTAPQYAAWRDGPAPRTIECKHKGAEVRRASCPTCAGRVELKVFACGKHGECTATKRAPGVAGCCVDACYESSAANPEAGRVRHLLYHVYPRAANSAVWRWNAEKLRRRLSLFNGRRIVGIATDGGTEPASAVREALPGCEYIEVANDPTLREMTSFPRLLESVSDLTGPEHATFYGHAKGISSESWASGVRFWTEAMYSACLDHWPAVQRMLATYPLAGPFKRVHYGFLGQDGKALSRSAWHYSGSFRWMRNADLFSRNWREIDQCWIGSESHSSLHFREYEAGCLFGEFRDYGIGLYAAETWKQWASAATEAWQEKALPDRWQPLLLTCILTSHRKPRTVHESIAGMLAQSSPDWQLLIMDSGDLAAAGEFDRYRSDPRIAVATTGETPDMRGRVCLQSWAINECFRRDLVRGDLCCYLSDDDVYDPGIFDAWLSAARQHPEQAAWYGPAHRCELRESGEIRVGDLPTVGPTRNLDNVVDGMQICHLRGLHVSWPEAPDVAAHADGVFMDAVGRVTLIHPVAALVGRHRHAPESTFTRPAP